MSNERIPSLKAARQLDHEQSDEALRRSEARYRALVEASSQAVWSWSPEESSGDFDGTMRWWEELTGQTIEEQKRTHTSWLEAVHPEDRSRAETEWTNSITNGTSYDVEYRVRARAGGWRHIRARGLLIPSSNGSPSEWVGTLHDITEQRRAEEEASASRERLSAALRAARMCAWTWDPEADRVVVSDTIAEVFGLRPGETLDSSRIGFGVLHPQDVNPHREMVQNAAKRGENWHSEFRIVRPIDGKVAWLEERATAERDPSTGSIRLTGLVWDVTERKQSAVESTELADKLQLAIGAGDLGTWEWNPSTDEMTLSHRTGEIYGIDPHVPHRREELRRLIHPDDRSRARDAAARSVAERSDYGIEYRLNREDGCLIWVAAHGRGVYDAAGVLVRVHGVVQDITERKRAEVELRDIRSRMEAALEAGAIGTWAWDVPNDRFYGDQSLARIFSVPLERVTGGSLAGLIESIHPDDRLRVQELVSNAVESGARYEADYRVTDGSGGWRWINARGQVERDEAGKAVRFPGVVIEISERKRAEEALDRVTADSERRKRLYEAVLSTTPDLAYVWGLDHRFTYANEGLLRMWGRTWNEAIGKNCLELGYEPWHAEMHDRDIEQVRRTKQPVRGEVPFAGTFGRRIYDYILMPVLGTDGEVEAVAGITRDVTDRKESEEELRKQTERLQLLWESASVLLTTDEPDAMIRGLFDRISEHFGLDTYFNFLVDPSGEFLQLQSYVGVSPETAESIRRLEFGQAVCGSVAMSHQPITAMCIQESDEPRVQLVKRFGIRAYACSPLLAGDRLLGTLSFASRTRDTFEADELEFLRTVCRYVTVAYERLRLVSELREQDRKKDDFIALLAHELRNPLAPIRNGLQVLRMAGANPDSLAKARGMMDRQLAHMVRLIDDLLDISRINRNKMELRRERVALSDVVANAVETARPALDSAGHELIVALPATPVFLDADLTRLAQVLSNLLTNSAKYTPGGGRVWLSAERGDGRISVEVRDTGIGIPAESISSIFDMFSQVDRSVEKSAGGLGIGLALVKGLVDMHGGTVKAASEGEGRGTTFTISLPEARPAEIIDPLIPASHCPQPSRRILVVDDNRDGAVSMGDMLSLLGHTVRTAFDGIEAITAAEAFQPDVILMDLGMPRLNGLDATRRIRQSPWGQAITIIALTGWGQENDRDKSRAAGCNSHLVKPVDVADLQHVLSETAS